MTLDPTKINLKDVGEILEGKLVKTSEGWVLQRDAETKKLDEALVRFEGKDVRLSIGDMELVQALENQVKDLAVELTGMSAEDISSRLKRHRTTALKLHKTKPGKD